MAVNYNPSIATDGLVLCLDPSNGKSFSPNVHPKPTDIYGWITAGSNCTLSRDTISSPVGNTPLKMVQTGNDPYTNSYSGGAGIWKLSPAAVGQTWTVSVWVKASQPIQIEGCWIAEQDASGNYLTGGGSPNPTIGTDWVRISGTRTIANASTAFVGLRLDGTQTGGSGITIWWDGLQLEQSSSASTFNARTNTNISAMLDLVSSTAGTISGYPSFAGNALTFNGSSQYITIPYAAKYNFNLAQTIAIWLKPTEADANRRNPYNHAYGGGGTITHEPSGSFNYYCGAAGVNGSPYIGFTSSFIVAQNEMAYITLTRDTNTISWYKNGVLSNTTENPYGNGIVTGTSDITIGNGYAGYYMGNIGAVQLYTRCLTAAEVNENFNALRGRFGI